MDLTKLVENTIDRLEEATSFERLGILAILHESQDPEVLKENAIKQVREHPLSSLFGKSRHDEEGKVIYKSSGGGFGAVGDEAIVEKVAEGQRVMRHIVVASAINPTLHSVSGENYPRSNDIETICQNSPFIPVDRRRTYFEGIRNFLFGNHINALNILVPQMENSIRHILKQNDFDPTSFDSVTHVQEDRPLTSLYSDMRCEIEHCFGVPISFEIENLFLTKSGPNIRNACAHGLMSDIAVIGSDAIYANWFIYRLCCIPLLPHWKELKS